MTSWLYLNHAGSVIWIVTTKVNVLQTGACSRYTTPASIARVWHWLLLGKWQYHSNIYMESSLNHAGSVIWIVTTRVNALLNGECCCYTMPTSIATVKWQYYCNIFLKLVNLTESSLNHAGSIIWIVTTKVNVLQTGACSRYTMPASIPLVWQWLLLSKWLFHCSLYIMTCWYHW